MPHTDFDIDRLAAYLHLTPGQVSKMAERGQLPGRRVAGQWRFSKADIHHWLEERIGASDDEQLTQVEQVLQRAAPDEQTRTIAEMLPLEAIAVPFNARTRSSAITGMVELAAQTGLLWDPAKLEEAVRARESLHPTALENGVALLHPRRPMTTILEEPFLALGITPRGIPFGQVRGMLTDVFFLICSVDDRGHLRTLARLSRLISDSDCLDALRQAATPADVHQAIEECEGKLLA